jgi:hypothetical protein
MSEAPELHPISAAFAAADAEAAAKARRDEAEKDRRAAEAQERVENEAFIRDLYRRQGAAMAHKFGRSVGIDRDMIDRLIALEDEKTAAKKDKVKAKKRAAHEPGEDAAPPDGAPHDEAGDKPPEWKKKREPIKPLPADCPVTPVGYNSTTCYFLNPHRQLIEMTKGQFGAEGIRLLFGSRQDWLWGAFPKYSEKTHEQTGWKADQAAETLIKAAMDKGTFDTAEMIRGMGGWRGEAGELVLHCGSEVLLAGESLQPGFVQGYLYAAGVASQKPAPLPADDAEARRASEAIERVLAMFDSYNWLDGPGDGGDIEASEARCFAADVDGSGHKLASLLVLGWLAGSRLGAALDFRSLMWITGDAGAGKTTLQRIIMAMTGKDMVQSSDTTGAGVYSAVGHSSRPVMIDEAEPDPFKSKMKDLISLARQAATGGKIRRGSSNHQAVYFEAKSAFLFSSIIIPPMQNSDISRFCILDLGPLGKRKPLNLDPAQLAYAGRVMLRRLIDGWARWDETLQAYRAALMEQGHDPRGADQFGALLAACDLMRGDAIAHPDTIDAFARALSAERMNEANPREANSLSMLNHLITVPLDVFRGGTRMTIGELVGIGAGVLKTREDTKDTVNPKSCQEALKAWSIYIDGFDNGGDPRRGSTARVILPNKSTALGRLFAQSQWYAEGGASGGWAQAMRRLKGARGEKSSRFGGRGWSVPVHVFLMSDIQEGDE